MKFKTSKDSQGKTTFHSSQGQVTPAQQSRETFVPREKDDGRAVSGAVKQTSPKGKRDGAGRVVLIIVLVLLVAVAAGAFLVISEVKGPRGGAEIVAVEIPEGASTGIVAEALKESGIVKSEIVFKLYCRFMGADNTFHFGAHPLSASMSYDELIEELKRETVRQVETFSITFPEGTTTLKMALMLEEKGICSADEFVEACNTGTYDVSFFSEISDTDKFIKLEGFLFPDTYEFEVGCSPYDMIQKMLENFEKKVVVPYGDAIAATGYSLEEIIILSSIVEKESVGADSYSRVSAVFYNRLNSSSFMCLESDTSCDWHKRDLAEYGNLYGGGYYPGVLQYYYDGYENIPEGIRDGYDTFSHEGLIVGAICNPGTIAIEGTITPAEDWPYYFFFTGPDKQTFFWSMTADEHSRQYNEQYR